MHAIKPAIPGESGGRGCIALCARRRAHYAARRASASAEVAVISVAGKDNGGRDCVKDIVSVGSVAQVQDLVAARGGPFNLGMDNCDRREKEGKI